MLQTSHLFRTGLGVVSLYTVLPANAQQASEQGAHGLEEVTVTARKRDESLQDVPISITAVSGESLRQEGVRGLEGFAPSIPNLQFSLQPSATDSIYIRGIGSGTNFGFETAVGLVVDGFYYGKTRIGRAAFLDLEQVEVLKGPQGAILGKNNSAGAINLTTAKPTDEFEAMLSGTWNFEGNDGYNFEGVVSGPLTDTLSARLAVRHDRSDGYFENLAFGRPEQQTNDTTGRLILEWNPTSDLSVMTSYQRVEYTRRGHGRELYLCGPGKAAQLAAAGYPADDCRLDYIKSTAGTIDGTTQRDRFTQELDLAHLAVQWDLGHLTLTSLTGYMSYESLDDFDGDNTPTVDSQVANPEQYHQILQELRLSGTQGRFDYILGAFFLWTENPAEFHFVLPAVGVDLVAAGKQDGRTQAAFGELTYRVTDSVDVAIGGRYTRETKDLNQRYYQAVPFTGVELGQVYQISPSRSETNFSPTLDVRWRAFPETMLYASARRGFRGGGFDRFLFAPDQATAEATAEFDEEKVTAFEVGSKSELLNDTLRLNVALFRSEYDDLQVASFVTSTQFRVDNAATATTQGIELGIDWQATSNLLINANLGYLNAEFDEFPNAQCYIGQTPEQGCRPGTLGQDLSGRPLPFAPDYQGSLGGTYEWELGAFLVTFSGQINRTGRVYLGGDLHPAKRQEAYDLINARVSLSNATKTWEISAIGRNLGDEKVMTAANNSSPDGIDAYLMEPRVMGVQATVRF